MMNYSTGLPKINIHKIRTTLDAENKVYSGSLLEYIFAVKDVEKTIAYTIADNIATITEEGYSEGDNVDVWLTCVKKNEKGGFCDRVITQDEEDAWQNYLDAL
jgi:hypothetical protein